MRIKSFIVVAFALAILADFSLAGETTEAKTPANAQAMEVTVKPAPFENYWVAQSWDVNGAAFWHTTETPAATNKKGTASATSKTIIAKK